MEDKEVKRKARKLLMRHLSFFQKLSWLIFGELIVKGNVSGELYKISSRSGHGWCPVKNLFTGQRYCVYLFPEGASYYQHSIIALDDDCLAKKLVIEGREDYFLAKANLIHW